MCLYRSLKLAKLNQPGQPTCPLCFFWVIESEVLGGSVVPEFSSGGIVRRFRLLLYALHARAGKFFFSAWNSKQTWFFLKNDIDSNTFKRLLCLEFQAKDHDLRLYLSQLTVRLEVHTRGAVTNHTTDNLCLTRISKSAHAGRG